MAILQLPSGVQIGNSQIPNEGPRAVPLVLDFSANPVYAVNVSDLFNKGPTYPGLSVIQCLYLDNSLSGSGLTVVISGTGQTVKVAAGTQGYYPILSPSTGQITFTSIGGVVVKADIINVPMPAAQWGGSGASQSPSYDEAGELLTKDTALDALIENGGLNVNVVGGGGGSGGLPQLYAPPAQASFPNVVGNDEPALELGTVTGSLVLTYNTGIVDSIDYAWQAYPATPCTITARVRGLLPLNTFPTRGLILADGTGKLITFIIGGSTYEAGGTVFEMAAQINYWNSITSFNATEIGVEISDNFDLFRVRDDGVNLTFSISMDGDVWIELLQVSRTAFLADGPTQVGFGALSHMTGQGWPQVPLAVACPYWNVTEG